MLRNTEFYLLMLERLLLEIRNLEESESRKSRSLAYIFHNVPGMLRCHFDESVGEEAFEVILSRAAHLGLTKEIEQWEKQTLKKLEATLHP